MTLGGLAQQIGGHVAESKQEIASVHRHRLSRPSCIALLLLVKGFISGFGPLHVYPGTFSHMPQGTHDPEIT
jgi:hypothetical protein